MSLGCREKHEPGENAASAESVSKEAVKAPAQIISMDEAQKLFDTYGERRVPLIERFEIPNAEAGAFEAARFTSFDYTTIKQYLAFIEQEADSADVDISSLRLYFGNYPSRDELGEGVAEEDARKNTIFIVPTLKKDGQEYGFFIQEGPDGQRKAVPLVERGGAAQGMGGLKEAESRSYAGFAPVSAPFLLPGNQSLILNRGNTGPPPNNDF